MAFLYYQLCRIWLKLIGGLGAMILTGDLNDYQALMERRTLIPILVLWSI